MRYVGITGFMSRAEVDACLQALPDGLTLMCGVLVSAKSLAGVKNKWHRRYPDPGEIAGIFSQDLRCLNLIHYSSGEPPDAGLVSRLQDVGGVCCNGFQFNGAWPTSATLAALSGDHVVLQVNPRRSEVMADFTNAHRGMRNVTPHVLIDGSGGRGEPISYEVADAWAMMFRGHYGHHVHVGIAGGMCAESLPTVAPAVRSFNLSIDAEGRLRDGDEGGTLNLDKARAYLQAAGECFKGAA